METVAKRKLAFNFRATRESKLKTSQMKTTNNQLDIQILTKPVVIVFKSIFVYHRDEVQLEFEEKQTQ